MDLDCSLSSLGYSFLSHSIAPHFRRHEPGNWQPGPPLSLMVDIRSLSACSIGATDPSPSRGPRSAFRPGMRKGTLAVKTLLLYLPSGSSWSSAFRPRLEIPAGAPTTTTVVAWPSGRLDSRFLSRMSCFGADAINLDEIWPQLAGKNTCANEAAGKVSSYYSACSFSTCLYAAAQFVAKLSWCLGIAYTDVPRRRTH